MSERSTARSLEPVRKKLVVPASPEVAFRRFTEEMATWWPLATHSVHGAGGDVSFGAGVGDPILERGPGGPDGPGGEEATWGTITEWDPPRRVAFTWHPGRADDTAQEVVVTFASTGDGTEVTLVHGGWEKLGEGAAEQRRSYDSGWEPVLGAFRDSL